MEGDGVLLGPIGATRRRRIWPKFERAETESLRLPASKWTDPSQALLSSIIL